jgi:hypothetical protein
VLVAACSSGADNPTAAPTVASAPATTAPSVAPAAPDGLFTGRVHCRLVETPGGGDPDAQYHTCYQAATDPRMAGTVDLQVLMSNAEAGQAFIAWGPSTITNDQGSWVCNEAGMGIADQTDAVYTRDVACVGKGGNIGLSAWMHALSSTAPMDWAFIGWIDRT